ncbi:MAG: argininosuccinate lyase [Puniceicoccaceae bacterium]
MSENKQATWGGRFSEGPADRMIRFSESVSFDKRLALYDIRGSEAQAKMLAHVGLITDEEAKAICDGLGNIADRIASDDFEWNPVLEDVHMNIEQALTEQVPAAAKLHTARSRNDQVATDMRLFFKDAASQLDKALKSVLRALQGLAEKTRDVAIPGYTHLQRAQPVSMAHHFLAYMEMFGRDLDRLKDFSDRANYCPLGSGAIAGTTLPIDREFSARELGFVDADGNPRVTPNSMDTVADRDLFIEFANCCALVATHLSRVAEDVIIWSTAEFHFVALPDTYTTGSSLMPQKKNPDSLELIRGKAARIMGHANTLMTLVKGLPLTYNRDLQEDKPPVFEAFDMTVDCLLILEGTLAGITVNQDACKEAVSDPLLLATDLVDYLVLKGVPFREAHHVVGALVALSENSVCPLDAIPLDEAQKVCDKIEADWVDCFNVQRALANRERTGMPGPGQIERQLQKWQQRIG